MSSLSLPYESRAQGRHAWSASSARAVKLVNGADDLLEPPRRHDRRDRWGGRTASDAKRWKK